MPVKKGDKLKVDYTGKLDDGTVFDTSTHGDHSHPLEFEAGSGQVIKGFDDAVMGMEKDEEKEFKIECKNAYGEHNASLIQKVPKDKFPKGQEPKAGMHLMLQSPEGQQIPAKITEVTDKEVTIDLNHPLAGKNLNFKIKIVDIA
ncbi:MAG: peptidylprolyl isomerase [Nanoarchaeota archaeon]|nr:peptidylprolyl isomerase [Nanoarchaeota archaeon]MBU1704315.1 peptidylprolyl isomerase [Nanoarchaeota archaeon]